MISHFAKAKSKKTKKDELYDTPYSMTDQLLDHESLFGKILEPACGKGAIVKVLKNICVPGSVESSDIRTGTDFLKNYNAGVVDTIITNPPYSLATEFILRAKVVATTKIMFLMPLYYLHGMKRFKYIWSDQNFPLEKVYVFIRYPMLGDKLRKDGKYRTGMQAYAWYVWKKWDNGSVWNKCVPAPEPVIRWIDNQKYVLNQDDKPEK